MRFYIVGVLDIKVEDVFIEMFWTVENNFLFYCCISLMCVILYECYMWTRRLALLESIANGVQINKQNTALKETRHPTCVCGIRISSERHLVY